MKPKTIFRPALFPSDAKTNAELMLARAPMNWQEAVDNLSTTERREVAEHLSALIQKAVRLHTYVDGRYGYGCGDQGHGDAVKASNKAIAQVRKALGFTYPQSDLSF